MVVAHAKAHVHLVSQPGHQGVDRAVAVSLDGDVLAVHQQLGKETRAVLISRDLAGQQLQGGVLRQVRRGEDVPYLRGRNFGTRGLGQLLDVFRELHLQGPGQFEPVFGAQQVRDAPLARL